MITTLKQLFGLGAKVNFADLVKQGAKIVDVRTKDEYASGAVRGSINIPLDQLSKNLTQFKDKNQVIITCCASGMRSASAKNILKSNGFANVHNGGGWSSLSAKISC